MLTYGIPGVSEAGMKKAAICVLLVFLSVSFLSASQSSSRRRDAPDFAVGFTPTDLFLPLFYGGFLSVKGEFMIGRNVALTVPAGYYLPSTDGIVYLGLGTKWLPMGEGLKGFYLGCDAMFIANIRAGLILPMFDFDLGYKLCFDHFFFEPEIGYGIVRGVDDFSGGFVAGLRLGVVF